MQSKSPRRPTLILVFAIAVIWFAKNSSAQDFYGGMGYPSDAPVHSFAIEPTIQFDGVSDAGLVMVSPRVPSNRLGSNPMGTGRPVMRPHSPGTWMQGFQVQGFQVQGFQPGGVASNRAANRSRWADDSQYRRQRLNLMSAPTGVVVVLVDTSGDDR